MLKYVGQVRSGVVRVIGRESVVNGSEHYKSSIYRICTAASSELLVVAYLETGLTIAGVDEWKCISDLRLINLVIAMGRV